MCLWLTADYGTHWPPNMAQMAVSDGNLQILYLTVLLFGAYNYFMSFSNYDMVFCSLDGKPVRAMEGFSVNVDLSLEAFDKGQIRSFILPGGDISEIDTPEVKAYLQAFMRREILIAGICAGVDVLDHAGILRDVRSTHSPDADLVTDKNVITARANAYVDFAVEIAKKLNLFASEDDLQETINFWKHYQRVQ